MKMKRARIYECVRYSYRNYTKSCFKIIEKKIDLFASKFSNLFYDSNIKFVKNMTEKKFPIKVYLLQEIFYRRT